MLRRNVSEMSSDILSGAGLSYEVLHEGASVLPRVKPLSVG